MLQVSIVKEVYEFVVVQHLFCSVYARRGHSTTQSYSITTLHIFLEYYLSVKQMFIDSEIIQKHNWAIWKQL